MISEENELIGYWAFASETQFNSQIYIRFAGNGLLQWGWEDNWNICVMPHDYWLENGNIGTICAPNPRKELTPYTITVDGTLKFSYSNRETLWVRGEKQNFFESENRKVCEWGSQFGRQFDYMSLLNEPPNYIQIRRAEYLGVSPQILVNTDSLWKLQYYCQAEFASFHLEDFKYILSRGVWVDEEDNMDTKLLSYFAGDGYTNAVELMLDEGFEINAIDILGNTALDYAFWKNRIETIKLLQERGAKTGEELKSKNDSFFSNQQSNF